MTQVPARQRQKRSFLSQWQLHAFMFVPMVILIVFSYVPMVGLVMAFQNYSPALGFLKSPWAGFAHFREFFCSYQFERIIGNTLRISAYNIFFGFPLPIIFALILNTLHNQKYKKVVQTLTYIPHFISTVVMVGILMQLLNPVYGAYGVLYRLFGGTGYPKSLLASPNAFIHVYFWSGIWQSLGWNSIIYIAALSGIDPEQHEAAQLDGASRFKRILHIDLPGILPTATVLLILSAGSVMNVGFEKVYLMQNTLNLTRSEVISTYVYKVGMTGGGENFSFATAVGLFNSVINCIILVLVNTLSRKLGGDSLW